MPENTKHPLSDAIRETAELMVKATPLPWIEHVEVLQQTAAGKEKFPDNQRPCTVHAIVTDWVHPQYKDRLPITTTATGPYYEPTTHLYIRPEDCAYLVAAVNLFPRMKEEIERLTRLDALVGAITLCQKCCGTGGCCPIGHARECGCLICRWRRFGAGKAHEVRRLTEERDGLKLDANAIEGNLSEAQHELGEIAKLVSAQWDSGFSPDAVTKDVARFIAKLVEERDAAIRSLDQSREMVTTLYRVEDGLRADLKAAIRRAEEFDKRDVDIIAAIQRKDEEIAGYRAAIEAAGHAPNCALYDHHGTRCSVCGLGEVHARAHHRCLDGTLLHNWQWTSPKPCNCWKVATLSAQPAAEFDPE